MNPAIFPVDPVDTPHGRDDRDVRRAWLSLAVAPVAFVAAFVIGEGTSSLLGYHGDGIAPWWMLVVTLLLALAAFCLPAVLATWFWRRAQAQGDDRGKAPAVVLITVSVGFLGLNLTALLVGLLLERF